MEKRILTCIGCPMGCQIEVTMDGDEVISLSGNTCKRGDTYARAEVTHPVRTVTGTVRVSGGDIPMVSVKTATDIPKEKISEIIDTIHSTSVTAPVKIGDVLIADVADTGVDVIATKEIEERKN